MARDYHLTQTGEETQEAINKILALDIATTDTPGLMSGEDKAILDALPSEVSDKANRASDATNGHLASLDASGNLVDSGKSVYDFATKEQGTLADSAYQKPENGIPASDMAPGVIPDVSDVVRTSVQSLSDGDKSQARENIGAASEGALEGKVDKVEGKGLSTNDYTDEDKSRVSYLPTALAGLGDAIRAKYTKPSTGIPASDIEDGVIPDVSNFITKSVDDLVNYYLKSETYTKDEVAALIGAIQQFHYEIYASRQDVVSPANNVLYLIGPTGSGTDKYEEYVYDSTKQEPWVKIGDTSIDLSGYVTTQALNTALAAYTTSADLATLLAAKQDVINDLADIRSGSQNNIKYAAQTLTDAQKSQARSNIGVPSPLVTYTPSGDVDPSVTPADYATKEELSQLDQVLEIDDHSGTVTERIGYGQHIGYIGTTGNITNQTTGNNRYSDPIHLKAGESLKINAISATNVARLSSWNVETGRVISVLAVGQSAGGTYPTDMYENTYTATEDIDVVITWNYLGPLELTKTYYKTDVSSRMDDLDAVEAALDMQEESGTTTAPVALTVIEGEYFSYSAVGELVNINSHANFNRSDVINVRRGDVITVVTSNLGTNVSLLVYKDGVRFRTIAPGDNTVDQTVTYTVPYDMQLAVCWLKAKTISVTLTRTGKRTWSQRLDDMEETVDTLGTIPGRMETVEDEVFFVDDDFSTGAVADKSIGINGYVNDYAGSKYKEYVVQRGSSVAAHVYTHPSVAAISRKMPDGKYVSLVPVTGFAWEDLTYIATEDMIVAVCTYNTSDGATAVVTTHFVQSNRADIVALQQEDASDEVRDIDLGFFFDKIAVIGDSMSVGTMDGYSTGGLGSSWLSSLAKRWNCTGKQFYAFGGTDAYGWLNNSSWGLGKMLADETVYNAYFIAYGHNDSASVGEATDAAAPVTVSGGVPSCPSGYSFCAYLKAIVAQIREKAPHAMIFMLSQYDYSVAPGGWHSSYGEAIIDVAEALYAGGDKLVHHLDTGGVPDADMAIGSHYSTVGYAYIAKRVNDEVNKVMYQYRADTEIKTFGVYNL